MNPNSSIDVSTVAVSVAYIFSLRLTKAADKCAPEHHIAIDTYFSLLT